MINQTSGDICLTDTCCDLMQRRGITTDQQETFISVLEKTQERLGAEDPRDILRSLVVTELEVVQKVHCLADPICVETLDREGALNLLLQPGSARDINNDGFLRIGRGWTWTFPPPNAPQAVKDAWEEHTAGMTEMESMLATAPFMVASLTANAKYDAQGNIIGFYGPWDPEYRNIFADPNFSYKDLVNQCLDNLEIAKPYYSLEDYENRKDFLTGFLELMDKYGAK